MPKVHYQHRTYALEETETVLDGLLRHGVTDIAFSCKAGACQSCLMQTADGTQPPPAAQRGLKETLKPQGYFLACQCRPQGDLKIKRPDEGGLSCVATVVEKTALTPEITLLRLKPEAGFVWQAGQFVNLVHPEDPQIIRSYSIASLPESGVLELHIRHMPHGRISTWIQTATVGDAVLLRGPAGDCFYLATDKNVPLVLAGTSTGLAPLLGVIRAAIAHGHKGAILLFHGALTTKGLYLEKELTQLMQQHQNIAYTPCVLDQGQDIVTLMKAAIAPLDLAKAQAYFCGAPDIVGILKKAAFLAGLSSKNIFSDSFLLATPPK